MLEWYIITIDNLYYRCWHWKLVISEFQCVKRILFDVLNLLLWNVLRWHSGPGSFLFWRDSMDKVFKTLSKVNILLDWMMNFNIECIVQSVFGGSGCHKNSYKKINSHLQRWILMLYLLNSKGWDSHYMWNAWGNTLWFVVWSWTCRKQKPY